MNASKEENRRMAGEETSEGRPTDAGNGNDESVELRDSSIANVEGRSTVVTFPLATAVVLWDELEIVPECLTWVALQPDEGMEAWLRA